MYPRFLAHSLHRLTTWQANFGSRVERTITDVRATVYLLMRWYCVVIRNSSPDNRLINV
jgi:hypothetical protein